LSPSPHFLFKVMKVYMGWSSPGQLMQYYPHLPSRFIVIPRHKGAHHQKIRFMDTDPFHVSYQIRELKFNKKYNEKLNMRVAQ